MPRRRLTEPAYTLVLRGEWYSVQWWDGQKKQRVACRTKDHQEAERFLADFRAGTAANRPPGVVTIGAILDGYEAERATRRHSPTLSFTCSTLRRLLGPLAAERLTRERVLNYQAERRGEAPRGAPAEHRKYAWQVSDGTLIRELGVLRTALTWATQQTPPWIAKAPHIVMPEAPEARDRWLTRDEARRLIKTAEAPHIALFIALALNTAARAGAILGLTWDRVRHDNRVIDLGVSRGKKRRARHLPVNDVLFPLLSQAREAATTQWVIEYRGNPVASVKTGFRAACVRAGLRGVTPHVMRHTAVTWMMQGNVPLPKIASFAAMSVEMVEKRYGHHSPDWMRQASEALAGDGLWPENGQKTKTLIRENSH